MKNIKKIWLALCMAVCLFALSGCGASNKENAAVDPSVVMSLQQGAEQYLQVFSSLTDEDLEYALESSTKNKDTVMINALQSWEGVRGDLGGLVSWETAAVEAVDDGYAARIHAVFEKRAAEFSLIVDEDLENISAISITPDYTTGEKMSKAAMNTVVGMGVVFIVLIFISWLISLFKYVHVFEEKMKGNAAAKAHTPSAPAAAPSAPAAAPAPAPAPLAAAAPAADDMDDVEFALVLATAIQAYEESQGAGFQDASATAAPAAAAPVEIAENGLVVRSIKRVPKRNWK